MPIDISSHASTVRLELNGSQNSINLSWDFDVPWSNSSSLYPMHYIYRNNIFGYPEAQYVLIDSVIVIENGFNYNDDGSFEDIKLGSE